MALLSGTTYVPMSIGSQINKHNSDVTAPFQTPRATFPCEVLPYLLSTADALIILLVSLFGAYFYHRMTASRYPTSPPMWRSV